MTREQAIKEYVIPALKYAWNEKIINEVLEALEQEDVTWIVGNDNVQIAVRNMPVDMMQKINAIIGNLQEPTTQNNCAERHGCITCSLDDGDDCCRKLYEESMQESTIKNDLRVDCVSREDALMCLTGEFEDRQYEPSELVSIFSKRIKHLPSVTPQEPRWIPVSERLPKIADVYRVTRYYRNNVMNPNYLVDACFFDGSNWYNDNRINLERCYAFNIIAWQENPEPYEPQESEEVDADSN